MGSRDPAPKLSELGSIVTYMYNVVYTSCLCAGVSGWWYSGRRSSNLGDGRPGWQSWVSRGGSLRIATYLHSGPNSPLSHPPRCEQGSL